MKFLILNIKERLKKKKKFNIYFQSNTKFRQIWIDQLLLYTYKLEIM